jgi:uncharacterized RDD family membrane protein YckC
MASSEETTEAGLPGIGRRLIGMLYEFILLIGVVAAAVVVPNLILALASGIVLPRPALRVYVFLVLAAYFLWQWRGGRQTLAMRTWKLRITSRSGGAPTLSQLALRYVLAWPSIALLGIGILWALVDRDRQFLHDRLAGTRIIFSTP